MQYPPLTSKPHATRRTSRVRERHGFPSRRDVNALPGVMETADLVDAALVGFDRREPVTVPPLPDAAQWTAFEAARQAMRPGFAQSQPAERYRVAA